jgi:integrating conjugative element protein (TIGR03759 family)
MKSFSILCLSVFMTMNLYAEETTGIKIKAIEEIEQMTEEQMQNNLNVSMKEYKEYYNALNDTLAGFRYSHMEPAEVLGIEAKTEEERYHFAKIAAKSQHDRVERELAFQISFTKALTELYPDELPFELTAKQKRFYGDFPKELKMVERFIFISNINEPDSAMLFDKLNARLADNKNVPIDIYFIGSAKDSDIQKWAAKQSISINDVKTKRITLNYHKNEIEKLTGSKDVDAPIVAYKQGGKTKLISLNGV